MKTTTTGRIWAEEPATGKRRDLTFEEHRGFWTWAMVEVLRLTGIRIEELTELSHHSLIQYRLPATGELIPLLQIAPSKTDQERLLVVAPELADVLSAIMCRIRGRAADVPLVVSYDKNERVYNPPMPLLFQWRCRLEHRPVGETSLRGYLDDALAAIGAKDASGQLLRYTFHDFRRLFITDVKIGGVASDATFPGRRERPWPALRRWGPRGERAGAGSKVADDLRCHHPVASAHTMMHPDLLHPAAA